MFRQNSNSQGGYYYYNSHGDVVEIKDESGKTLNSYNYDIWGNIKSESGDFDNPYKYSGQIYDPESGYYYLTSRYYDPKSMRFINEDTYEGDITNPLSLNLYTYVSNNPLIYTDPSGHRQEMGAGWGGFAGNAYSATDPWKGWSGPVGSVANFLILDDINTLRDPSSSGLAKGLATAGFLPIGKAIKGGKLILTLKDKAGKVVEKEFKLVDEALDYAKACNCFAAGTTVQTDEGEKNIEDIKVGDKVLSKNEETGDVAYREVTATFNHGTDEIYNIHVGSQTIESTFNHPFYVQDKGWTFVKDLKVGDLLVQSDGNTLKIESIELVHKHVAVYNMTVDDFHTYFVSELGIWVHNTNCDIKFSDKFNKPQYKNQVAERGWTNESIANAIENPVKTGTTTNKYTGNSVTLYYVDDVHYVAVDKGTGKVIQVADLNKADWKMDLTK
ncbi:polymorphic toxin-type HINT domain-containing protein [Paenibacillus enshidis]|uniref:Polymorphic toxin-type HINT domain-containing protein n=1 Tax=Paenibacillus enshidis TaxID=1458439 RepID=A0ABV5AXX3_9BACL